MKVGDTYKDLQTKEEYVVAHVWEHDTHTDYALFHKETGEQGSLRIGKTNPTVNK